jgi:L-asparagine transporter-like permease
MQFTPKLCYLLAVISVVLISFFVAVGLFMIKCAKKKKEKSWTLTEEGISNFGIQNPQYQEYSGSMTKT